MRDDGRAGELFAISLSAAVPRHIMELQRRGGPTLADVEAVRETGQLLAEKGDVLLFRSEKKGEAARIFDEVAFAIAVLAFLPGGVRIFGQHYEAVLDAP